MDINTIAGIILSTLFIIGISYPMFKLAINIHQTIREHDV